MANLSALESMLSSLVVIEKGFELDNRTVQSNLEFIQQYARYIPYSPISGADEALNTWASILFMDGNTPEKLAGIYQDRALADGMLWPQQALLLAFLEVLQTPRALLNYYPYAHRELYYRQLLGLSERAAEPSKVALSFQLFAKEKELLIPAGTVFSAGQDSDGTPMDYALDNAVLANQSAWTDLRWCWRPELPGLAKSRIAYDEQQQQSWPEGGLRLFSVSSQDQTLLTGRMVTSAILGQPAAKTFQVTLSSSIQSTRVTLCQISGGDHWISLTNTTSPGITSTLTFVLPEGEGPVKAPADLGGLSSSFPLLKLGCSDQEPLPSITQLKVNSDPAITDFEQFVLTPFGYSEEAQPVEAAQLYLGFSGIQPGQTLYLYWQLQGAKELKQEWQYLNAVNRWAALDATVIDDTLGLFRSGLWSAILPADASNLAPSMPSGRYWLRALMFDSSPSSPGISDYPIVVGLVTNGMTATLLRPETLNAASLNQPLPPNTISQPMNSVTGLSSTQQPWPSWGGRPKETSEVYFERVAQRLSHRHRALTWQDMVVILKTQFKAVYDVATPARLRQTLIPAVREQWLIVIPLNADKDNDDPLRPKLNSAHLHKMASYLQRLASPWQNIEVNNPNYRDVRIVYDLSFLPGVNPDYGYRQVRSALEQHYMPWSGDRPGGVKLASRLDYYDVIAQIQQQPEVDHVIDLTLDGTQSSIQGEDDEVLILVWAEELQR